jgi:hypothetical protein
VSRMPSANEPQEGLLDREIRLGHVIEATFSLHLETSELPMVMQKDGTPFLDTGEGGLPDVLSHGLSPYGNTEFSGGTLHCPLPYTTRLSLRWGTFSAAGQVQGPCLGSARLKSSAAMC